MYSRWEFVSLLVVAVCGSSQTPRPCAQVLTEQRALSHLVSCRGPWPVTVSFPFLTFPSCAWLTAKGRGWWQERVDQGEGQELAHLYSGPGPAAK